MMYNCILRGDDYVKNKMTNQKRVTNSADIKKKEQKSHKSISTA